MNTKNKNINRSNTDINKDGSRNSGGSNTMTGKHVKRASALALAVALVASYQAREATTVAPVAGIQLPVLESTVVSADTSVAADVAAGQDRFNAGAVASVVNSPEPRVAMASNPVDPSASGNPEAVARSGTRGQAMADPHESGSQDPRWPVASVKMSGPVQLLADQGGEQTVDLVVRYDQHPEMFDDDRVAALGGEVIRSFDNFEMRAIRLPARAIIDLAMEETVEWMSEDGNVMSTSVASREAANLPALTSSSFHYSGSGVGVAVIDTGVAVSADLNASIVQYDFSGGRGPTSAATTGNGGADRSDAYGHGTHVAAIVAARTSASGIAEGVAKGASIVSFKVLDNNGGGSASDVIAALDWILANGHQHNIKVVNLSLGMGVRESVETDPMVLAAERLWDAGIVVVAAAGNDGFSGNMTINSPGNSRKIITVGSVTDAGTGGILSDDYVSSFSSMGPTAGDLVLKPDLLAPGNKVVAINNATSQLARVLPNDRKKGCTGSSCEEVYLEMSGTSMAAPMVSAAVARLLERDPSLSPATIKARLMRSARKLSDEPTAAGAGVLDVDAFMSAGGAVSGQALSPLVVRDAQTGDVFIEDTGRLWGSSYWASGYIYSGGFNWAEGVAPDTLGDLSANGFLWTDSSVWSRGFMWTDESDTTGGVWSRGFMWTDEGGGTGARSLMEEKGGSAIINDDP